MDKRGSQVRAVYHPREEGTDAPLSPQGLEELFGNCADLVKREVRAPSSQRYTLYWLDGMIRSDRLSEDLIRPLMTLPLPRERQMEALLHSGIWNMSAQQRCSLEEVAQDLTGGMAAVFLDGGVITCSVESETKRAVSAVENEVAEKGGKEAFVESLQTNTALVRRRIRTQRLRLEGHEVGRQTRTAVDLVWLEGLTNPELVEKIRSRVDAIDIDALLNTEDFAACVAPQRGTAFPQMFFTERPDRFCRSVLDGRVGVLMEGIPLGAVLPGNLLQFLEAPQDREYHWMMASALVVLRCVCMMVTLALPGLFIAVASFHIEMLPTKLAMSIIASKQDVPFSTFFEVMTLLLAFEILQEAGLRLPKTMGQTVSILGGLVVGQAAVEAKIVSPAVVIVVAVAGITGFTMPSQDLANALRIWRLVLSVLAGTAGFFGLTAGAAALVCHLSGMESFGVAYLTPFVGVEKVPRQPHALLRQPVSELKLRELTLRPGNRRRQR